MWSLFNPSTFSLSKNNNKKSNNDHPNKANQFGF